MVLYQNVLLKNNMTTSIFTTKKLEKIIQKKIDIQTNESTSPFGKWNASVLYIARKKCLIFVNSKTFYSVIIPRFSTSELKNINELFLENFQSQLTFEKINVELKDLKQYIGEINFHKTDNDKKMNGIINYNISIIDYLKYDYELFNSNVIREITGKLNITPFKQINWKFPKEMMLEMIKTFK